MGHVLHLGHLGLLLLQDVLGLRLQVVLVDLDHLDVVLQVVLNVLQLGTELVHVLVVGYPEDGLEEAVRAGVERE